MPFLMTKETAVCVCLGVSATFTDLLGNSFVETAFKGIVGGVAGYLGKVVIVWIIKKIVQLYKKQKTKNK